MREMNLKNEFAEWFYPKAPKSYKAWFKNNLNEKLNEIDRAYIASFKKSLFNIDFENVNEEISKINNNLSNKLKVDDKTFAKYSKGIQNGIPNAIINTHYVKFLKIISENGERNMSKVNETFEAVIQHYRQYLGTRLSYEGEGNFRKILGFFPAYNDYFPYFGIRNKKDVLIIEFYIEKGVGTPLHTAIKHEAYWEEVRVFEAKIKCDTNWPTGGHLSIECNYSLSVEKLCAYISEFIYQVKSRIESITGGSK